MSACSAEDFPLQGVEGTKKVFSMTYVLGKLLPWLAPVYLHLRSCQGGENFLMMAGQEKAVRATKTMGSTAGVPGKLLLSLELEQ